MKKIFMILSASATLMGAVVLTSCNNAEEVKKKTDEQNAAIQAAVDAKLSGLQDQANKDCSAMVDSLANVKFEAWKEEEAKAHKGKSKPKPKPAPKPKEQPKADNKPAPTNISNRGGTNQSNNSTISNRGGSNQSNTNSNISKRGGATTTPH